MFRYLPVIRTFGEITWAIASSNCGRITSSQSPVYAINSTRGAALQQTEAIHKELKRLICGFDITLAFQIPSLHKTTRMTRFSGTQNAPIREGHFAARRSQYRCSRQSASS